MTSVSFPFLSAVTLHIWNWAVAIIHTEVSITYCWKHMITHINTDIIIIFTCFTLVSFPPFCTCAVGIWIQTCSSIQTESRFTYSCRISIMWVNYSYITQLTNTFIAYTSFPAFSTSALTRLGTPPIHTHGITDSYMYWEHIVHIIDKTLYIVVPVAFYLGHMPVLSTLQYSHTGQAGDNFHWHTWAHIQLWMWNDVTVCE